MKAIIIHQGENNRCTPNSWILTQHGKQVDDGRCILERGECWISSEIYTDLETEFEDHEKETLRSALRNPTSFIISWRAGCEDLLAELVRALFVDDKTFIDNDDGLFCSLHELKDLTHTDLIHKLVG